MFINVMLINKKECKMTHNPWTKLILQSLGQSEIFSILINEHCIINWHDDTRTI